MSVRTVCIRCAFRIALVSPQTQKDEPDAKQQKADCWTPFNSIEHTLFVSIRRVESCLQYRTSFALVLHLHVLASPKILAPTGCMKHELCTRGPLEPDIRPDPLRLGHFSPLK